MPKKRSNRFKKKGDPELNHPGKRFGIIGKNPSEDLRSKSISSIVPTMVPQHIPGSYPPSFPPARVLSHGSCSAAQGEEDSHGDRLAGYIFLCSGQTKPECFRFRVFGLPAARMEVVAKIKPSTKLFLFDFSLKLLYGVYIAASKGEMGLEPAAFGGKFPAQVRFEILRDCLPLPESAFKHVIKENYGGGSKFCQEINNEQVNSLLSLFRPIALQQPAPYILPNSAARFSSTGKEELGEKNAPRMNFTHFEPAIDIHHVQESARYNPYEPHRIAARLAGLLPPLLHRSHVNSQPQHNPYYPPAADRSVLPQGSCGSYMRYPPGWSGTARESIAEQGSAGEYISQDLEVVDTDASVQARMEQSSQLEMPAYNPHPSHSQPPSSVARSQARANISSSSLTAAYWAEIASRDANAYFSHNQGCTNQRESENDMTESGNCPLVVSATNISVQAHGAPELPLNEQACAMPQLQPQQQAHMPQLQPQQADGPQQSVFQEQACTQSLPQHSSQLSQHPVPHSLQQQTQNLLQQQVPHLLQQQTLHQQVLQPTLQPFQQQVPPQIPAYYPQPSASATYWVKVASTDTNLGDASYYQGQPRGSTNQAPPEKRDAESAIQSVTTDNYPYHNLAVAATSAPVPEHAAPLLQPGHVLRSSQFQAQQASSLGAAYWSAVASEELT